MQTLKKRLAWIRLFLILLFSISAIWLALLSQKSGYIQTAIQQSTYTVTAGTANGTIYDRNGTPLVNATTTYQAVVSPTAEAVEALLPHVLDKTSFLSSVEQGMPFVCEIDTAEIDCADVTILEIPERYAVPVLAQHLIGYTADGVGVSGIEAAFDNILRSETSRWSVTFSVDGTSGVLSGDNLQIRYGANPTYGVITTLDADIQRLCETAGASLEKGCIIVMEVNSGDILGMASFPCYSVDNLSAALEDENSPLINRALYAYPVGSIFKLVTATCAKESGIAYRFQYDCTGVISIGTQEFHCHDRSGHGIQNMLEAMRSSCNPYFIALSQELSAITLLNMAKSLRFGEEIVLASGITALSGTLPTVSQLNIPAERANFCFGQGILTATPLQIARMTCAIAGDGSLPMGRLILGITENGREILNEEEATFESGISEETAAFLRTPMCYAASSEDFEGCPKYLAMGAKTSTAQTERYDENGVEYCDGWVTAFFPSQSPKYVVTVLAEDDGYGNDCASPVLREIAAGIMALESP